MKVVAVSQRVDFYPDRNERRDTLDQRLIDFLMAAGYLPVPVPNNLLVESVEKGAFAQWIAAVEPGAVVLSGGNDIGSCKRRDMIETALLDHAERARLPALGICRGMQMMGVRAGGELHTVVGHLCTRHVLTGEITREVNSFHNYVLRSCPVKYDVIARSSDGEIEAIRHQSLSWEGWMWHPEREDGFNAEDIIRINDVFSERRSAGPND